MAHSIDVIQHNLSKLQPLNYNQFFWWRRWAPKNKTLHKYQPLWNKIVNGDYEASPYFWQIQYCEWEIEQKEIKFAGDRGRIVEETKVDTARLRRLVKDHETYEKENLAQLQKDFTSTFQMSKEDYERELETFDGDVKEFYIHCELRYPKYNIVTTKPRRGRPPKVNDPNSPF